MTDKLEQQESELRVGGSVAETVQANTRMLQQLLGQVSELSQLISSQVSNETAVAPASGVNASDLGDRPTHVGHQKCEAERKRLEDHITELESRLEDFQQQNRELASRVADKNVRKAITDAGAIQAMTWEQRKQLILQQMEEESFDAESFVANMPYQKETPHESPEAFVERLTRELDSRNQEVQELRHLLDQQSKTHEGQIAIGATAIAEMIDNDDLVRQERERLQRLQVEWEEKFREGEIAASLERAKLSRERQELAKRQAELEEELEHTRRDVHQRDGAKPASSRRWLVKLGLGEPS